MKTFVIYPKDQVQQEALQIFLEGSHIAYKKEPDLDETERIRKHLHWYSNQSCFQRHLRSLGRFYNERRN